MNEDLAHRYLYQYPTMKDVAMDILYLTAIDEGHVELAVEWWNVGPHEPFNMGRKQRFVMPLSWVKELEEYIYQGKLFTIAGV